MRNRMHDRDPMLAIDIGTTKVCAVVARRNERRVIEILGHGLHPCSGLSATGIVNLEEIVASISNACHKALNHVPGLEISQAVTAVSGTFIQSQNTTGSLILSKHGRPVNPADIQQCTAAAIRKSVPSEFEVIHSLPRWFRLDETPFIRDPVGMVGTLLEVDVHLIIGRVSILKNLRRCVAKAGFGVEELVYQPVASSHSVLSEDEKNIGVALVDIGGETTSLLVFIEGSIYHSETLGIGGEDITRDINHYFQTPLESAEQLKKYAGSAWLEAVDPEEPLEVVRFKNRRTITVKRRLLCTVIEARVEEIIEEVLRSLRSRGLMDSIFGGVVLTGGSALLEGIQEKARDQLQWDAHIGFPNGVAGYEEIVSSPSYATVIGLLHYGYERRDARAAVYGPGWPGAFRRAWEWLRETF
ncbi:MAG TPA: cell division protein FtsA [bacterium]|nr:cell division protein FtsA [bacterium]HXK92808.1 cell division protein FtsA [bacterium]